MGRTEHLALPLPVEVEAQPREEEPRRRWWQGTPEDHQRIEEALAPLRHIESAVDGFFEVFMRVSVFAAAALIFLSVLFDTCRR